MKTKFYLSILITLIFLSCSDETTDGLTSENASDEMSALAGEMNDDVVAMVQSEGLKGLVDFVDLLANSSEFGRISPYTPVENRSVVQQQVGVISHYFTTGLDVLDQPNDDDLTDFTGIYEWNFDLEDFEWKSDADILVLRFPTEGSTVNNAEFKLTEFEIQIIDGEEWPTSIKAELHVDETQYVNLDFTVNYSSIGDIETADIFLDVLPFSLDIRFDDTQSSSSSLAVSLLRDGVNIIGIDVTVDFSSEYKLEPVAVSGEVSYRNLKIVGSFSDPMMDESEDGNPNDYFDLALFINEEKIGDIIFVLEEIEEDGFTYDEYVAYVEYSDGSKENLEEILSEVISEIEDAVEDLS